MGWGTDFVTQEVALKSLESLRMQERTTSKDLPPIKCWGLEARAYWQKRGAGGDEPGSIFLHGDGCAEGEENEGRNPWN